MVNRQKINIFRDFYYEPSAPPRDLFSISIRELINVTMIAYHNLHGDRTDPELTQT